MAFVTKNAFTQMLQISQYFISTLGDEVDDIWNPDTFIRNERSVYFHQGLRPNKYARIWPDGRVST